MPYTDYKKLKVGIVGAGLMGRWHAKLVTRQGAKIIAIVDGNTTIAKQLAKEIDGTAQVFVDIDSMLADCQLDVLHICTPLNSHFSLAMRAISAGIHVIVEKPMAETAEETKLLLDASEKNNVKICPVHQFGFQDGVMKVISEASSLGDLVHLRFTTGSAGGEGRGKAPLNEIIADIIPHPLSVLQRLCPHYSIDNLDWQGISSCEGELQIMSNAGGVGLDIYISMNSRPTRCEMELFYTKGRAVLNFFHGYVVIEKGSVSRLQKMIQPFVFSLNEFFVAGINITKRIIKKELAYPGLSYLIQDFYRTIIAEEKAPIKSSDSLAIAKIRNEIVSKYLPELSESKK